ncbi:sensor histidine kinase [Mesorhizobium sp. M2E.F.Ca.ET.219.01.1.1]|uniref:ATP-binding protein n=1 Tax=Mesorhizobium sp. M2E.F.Ca.ET.219.01.1.1 TaxID=2500530 RepID=UPI002479E40E|nr:sensor histidine kinase [Mesorhizobium sp. M2E.F.Ca.ET.219.01.1.1]
MRLAERAKTLVISVEDDGPGIPEDLVERVVEPFFKVDTSRPASEAGFGLGLSIVSDITRSHHGSLQLQRRTSQGLKAVLEIPKIIPAL